MGSTIIAKGHLSSSGLTDGVLLAAYVHGGIDTDPLTVAEALAMASDTASDTLYVRGEITAIDSPYDASKKRLSFSMGDLKFVAGKLGTDVSSESVAVGVIVIVKGKLIIKDGVTTFDGLPQIYKVITA